MSDPQRALLFRCDATPETGLGHFARCRDLARLLTARNPTLRIEFVGALSAYAQTELRALGFGHVETQPEEPISERLLKGASACILDSYRLTPDDFLSPALAELSVGAFDDFGVAENAPIDLILNSRVSASERFSYAARAVALGPAFLGPSPELVGFRKRAAERKAKVEIEQIAVFIGATDHYGAGETVVRAALAVFPRARVDWVGGRSIDARVRQIPFGPNIAGALEEADLALAGGGRLKYEAGYALVPLGSISQTPLQEEDTCELHERGLCVDLGRAWALTAQSLEARLEPLTELGVRSKLRQAQTAVFQADAPERLTMLVERALGLERSLPRPEDRDSR